MQFSVPVILCCDICPGATALALQLLVSFVVTTLAGKDLCRLVLTSLLMLLYTVAKGRPFLHRRILAIPYVQPMDWIHTQNNSSDLWHSHSRCRMSARFPGVLSTSWHPFLAMDNTVSSWSTQRKSQWICCCSISYTNISSFSTENRVQNYLHASHYIMLSLFLTHMCKETNNYLST